MTVKVFLTVIYLGLTLTTSVNGQFFPRNYLPSQSQPPRSPLTQPYGQQNFSPSGQPPGFSRNPQVTSPQNVPPNPSFSSFPPQGFNVPQFPNLRFPQGPSSNPPPINQPTFFPPQNPTSYDPTFTSQRPSSRFRNPQQTSPFYTGGQGPGSAFTNPRQRGRYFTHPQQSSPYSPKQTNPYSPTQTSPYNTQPTSLLSTAPRPQQANPSYTNPQGTVPTFLGPQQKIPQFTNPQQFNPGFTGPQQTSPQEPIPTSLDSQIASLILSYIPQSTNPHQSYQDSTSPQQANTGSQQINSESAIPQQFGPGPTVPQQSNSDISLPQQPSSASTVPQQSNPDSIDPQQSGSDSTVPQQSNSPLPQQPSSDSTVPQQTDSDSTSSKKTNPTSDDVKTITSASEESSSVAKAPQDDSSLSAVHHHSPHVPRTRSSGTRYRPRSGKHTNFQNSGDPLKGLRIVCLFNCKHYYKSGFTPAKLQPHLCTHLNYEFAMLDPKTYEMIPGDPDLDIDQNFFEEALGLKKVNPKLKVLISLGGWSDSTKKYSDLAGDPAKRKNFISKAIDFLQKHGFDGMDLAWEYPNCWQGAIGVHPEDKQNFVTLLNETNTEFKKHNLILSVSVGAIKREVEAAYNVPEVSKNVDYINVMTYDMHGPWEPKTSHHVQFEAMPGDTDPYCNVKGGMQVWHEKGADKKKMNMGLAFYARTFQMKPPYQCGMGVPAKGPGAAGPMSKEGGILSYHEMCKFLNSGNWTEKEDKHCGFYACSGDQWACYDPPFMMVMKAKYVVEFGYGGVLIKDLSGDDSRGECFNMPFPLLRIVRMEMVRKARQTLS